MRSKQKKNKYGNEFSRNEGQSILISSTPRSALGVGAMGEDWKGFLKDTKSEVKNEKCD